MSKLADLLCPLCAIDLTIKTKYKLTQYSLSKLNYHVTAGTHSREEQLKRAIKEDNIFPIMCPSCNFPFKNSCDSIKHINEIHRKQLWQDIGDDEEEEELGDGSDGNEDDGDGDEHGDPILPPTDINQPVPYTGKGIDRLQVGSQLLQTCSKRTHYACP
jgi:uncharacterized C2H2 Zn-finger protein